MQRQNLTGQKFGRLTVIAFDHKTGTSYYWRCECECGKLKAVRYSHLKSGETKSCGCHSRSLHTTHGLTLHKIYPLYDAMRNRCYNSKDAGFKHYGGRGITMCDEWKSDRTKFLSWAFENGWQEGLQLDRINNDGNYSPENCRFVTPRENSLNRRSNRTHEQFQHTPS
jgi:hypothetical protein